MPELKLFQLNNVSFQKERNQIVDKISFSLEKNQLATIIGPNGAGKTTILKLIIGSINPTSGNIWKYKKLKIGYVPQKLNLSSFLPIRVSEFLTLNKLTIDKELVELIKIESLLNHSFSNLSGGELQRVLLARSLAIKPNLLILDEPDQNLDLMGQNEFFDLIERVHRKYNLATLIVSHNLNMVMAKTTKVYCINKHICCAGKPEVIKNDPKFTEIFGKKLAIYEHQHNHKHQ
ncbi:MAG: ATP-binding cassette domain-containing protein [Alphaproteobacteria bacterium]|jgi:zinc transport system ATP-binding protein|nr:ATP-binding cassette domain-containing protein [Alphaproteobacteria bacterium]MBT5827676.1 ATP-binding cassette domain-containing protein [Alphaproteobacteria bacterium]